MMYNGFRQTCALRGATVDAERAQQGPLLLISANCPQVISAMPLLTRDNVHPGKLEDVLKTSTIHDDVGDCLRYGYKSMLDPKSQAPREVRRQQELAAAAASIVDRENAWARMNAIAMADRQFQARELARGQRQRWR